jgi:hypothetical protein
MPQPVYTREDYFYSIISGRLYVRGKRVHGSSWGNGYLAYSYQGKPYAAHRLAWFLVTGEWPFADIDHIDRNRRNNGFHNLREADDKTNPQNRGPNCTNHLNVKGVRRLPSGSYDARITKDYKTVSLGAYPTIEQAAAARRSAEKELFSHAV